MAGRPLRALWTGAETSEGLVEMTDSELNDLVAPLLLQYHIDNPYTTYGLTVRINSSGAYDVDVGSAYDYNANTSVGGHPASLSLVNTYTFKQSLRSASPVPLARPVTYSVSGGETQVIEMTDDQIRDYLIAPIMSSVINGGQGSYYLGLTTVGPPNDGSTWSAYGTAYDTYYDNSGLQSRQFTLWQRTSANPTLYTYTGGYQQLRPLKQTVTSGVTKLIEMTDAEIQSLYAYLGNYIYTTGIGKYAVQSSAPGSGTWTSRGSFENLSNQTASIAYAGSSFATSYNTSYTGSFTTAYTPVYSQAYTQFETTYAGFYTATFMGVGIFQGASWSNAFTAGAPNTFPYLNYYSRNKSSFVGFAFYTGGVSSYVGNAAQYAIQYAGTYTYDTGVGYAVQVQGGQGFTSGKYGPGSYSSSYTAALIAYVATYTNFGYTKLLLSSGKFYNAARTPYTGVLAKYYTTASSFSGNLQLSFNQSYTLTGKNVYYTGAIVKYTNAYVSSYTGSTGTFSSPLISFVHYEIFSYTATFTGSLTAYSRDISFQPDKYWTDRTPEYYTRTLYFNNILKFVGTGYLSPTADYFGSYLSYNSWSGVQQYTGYPYYTRSYTATRTNDGGVITIGYTTGAYSSGGYTDERIDPVPGDPVAYGMQFYTTGTGYTTLASEPFIQQAPLYTIYYTGIQTTFATDVYANFDQTASYTASYSNNQRTFAQPVSFYTRNSNNLPYLNTLYYTGLQTFANYFSKTKEVVYGSNYTGILDALGTVYYTGGDRYYGAHYTVLYTKTTFFNGYTLYDPTATYGSQPTYTGAAIEQAYYVGGYFTSGVSYTSGLYTASPYFAAGTTQGVSSYVTGDLTALPYVAIRQATYTGAFEYTNSFNAYYTRGAAGTLYTITPSYANAWTGVGTFGILQYGTTYTSADFYGRLWTKYYTRNVGAYTGLAAYSAQYTGALTFAASSFARNTYTSGTFYYNRAYYTRTQFYAGSYGVYWTRSFTGYNAGATYGSFLMIYTGSGTVYNQTYTRSFPYTQIYTRDLAGTGFTVTYTGEAIYTSPNLYTRAGGGAYVGFFTANVSYNSYTGQEAFAGFYTQTNPAGYGAAYAGTVTSQGTVYTLSTPVSGFFTAVYTNDYIGGGYIGTGFTGSYTLIAYYTKIFAGQGFWTGAEQGFAVSGYAATFTGLAYSQAFTTPLTFVGSYTTNTTYQNAYAASYTNSYTAVYNTPFTGSYNTGYSSSNVYTSASTAGFEILSIDHLTYEKIFGGFSRKFSQTGGVAQTVTIDGVEYSALGYDQIERAISEFNAQQTNTKTWTVPTGVTSADVYAVGGGGSGGRAIIMPLYGSSHASNNQASGGGGGGGGTKYVSLTGLTPGNSIPITIGRGGNPHSNVTPYSANVMFNSTSGVDGVNFRITASAAHNLKLGDYLQYFTTNSSTGVQGSAGYSDPSTAVTNMTDGNYYYVSAVVNSTAFKISSNHPVASVIPPNTSVGATGTSKFHGFKIVRPANRNGGDTVFGNYGDSYYTVAVGGEGGEDGGVLRFSTSTILLGTQYRGTYNPAPVGDYLASNNMFGGRGGHSGSIVDYSVANSYGFGSAASTANTAANYKAGWDFVIGGGGGGALKNSTVVTLSFTNTPVTITGDGYDGFSTVTTPTSTYYVTHHGVAGAPELLSSKIDASISPVQSYSKVTLDGQQYDYGVLGTKAAIYTMAITNYTGLLKDDLTYSGASASYTSLQSIHNASGSASSLYIFAGGGGGGGGFVNRNVWFTWANQTASMWGMANYYYYLSYYSFPFGDIYLNQKSSGGNLNTIDNYTIGRTWFCAGGDAPFDPYLITYNDYVRGLNNQYRVGYSVGFAGGGGYAWSGIDGLNTQNNGHLKTIEAFGGRGAPGAIYIFYAAGSSTFVSPIVNGYTASFVGSYTKVYTVSWAQPYTQNYTNVFTTLGVFAGQYTGNVSYTSGFTSSYIGSWSRTYTGVPVYRGSVYTGAYTGGYTGTPFVNTYAGAFTKAYTGAYTGSFTGATTTVTTSSTTYTLWLRTA